jgi:putative (di)nucleoside polyphosphate hydrolase
MKLSEKNVLAISMCYAYYSILNEFFLPRDNLLNLPYRRSIVAVITNDKGELLVGERSKIKGAWQFPQGGIEPEETPEQALFRELSEEIGCSQVVILKQLKDEIRYEFPPDLDSSIKERFCGQTQIWFLAKFQPGCTFDLAKADNEFINLKWAPTAQIVNNVVPWKKRSYLLGLTGLGLWKE